MIKNFFYWLVFVAMAFVVQSSFLPIIHYHNVGPDLLLLIVGSFAFQNGSRMGCFMGFMVGVFQDLATGTFFGLNAFSKLLIGYVCGIPSSRVIQDNFMLPISASVVTSVMSYVILGVLVFLLGYGFNPLVHLTENLLPALIYNMVFAYPVHCMVRILVEKTAEKKNGNV